MTAQINQPSENEEITGEEQTFIQEERDLGTETAEFKVATEGLLTLLLYYVNRRSYIHWAHKILNQEDLGRKLLDADPKRYEAFRKALNLTPRLEKEKGRWHMDREVIKRKRHAFVLARRVRQRVNATEISLKIQSAIRRYGLEEEQTQKLRLLLEKWLIKNPKADLDSELILQATKLRLSQEGLISEQEIKDKKSLKKAVSRQSKEKQGQLSSAEEGFKQEASSAKQLARERNAQIIRRGELALEHISDPSLPAPSSKQTASLSKYINEGAIEISILGEGRAAKLIEVSEKAGVLPVSTIQPKPTIDLEALAKGFSEVVYPEEVVPEIVSKEITPSQATVEKTPAQQRPEDKPPDHPPDQPPSSGPPPSAFPITRLRERIIVSPISANIGRLTSAVANIENRIRLFGADLLKGGFSKLIKSKFLTTAINTGLSILSGGTYKALQIAATAASYLLRLLGIDIDFGRLAIVGIASIVILVFAIPFFFLNFGLVGLSRVIPNYGVENAMKVAYDKQPVLSWREFEKRFLTINKNGEDGKVVSFNDWLIFEKEFLSFKNYTSP